MRRIAIAFSVGSGPSSVERLERLVALEEVDGVLTGRAFEYDSVQGPLSDFIEQLATFCTGATTLIVHRAAKWRRVLRKELSPEASRKVRPVLKKVFDLASWSIKQFPRQRASLSALCRRLQLSVPTGKGANVDAQRMLAIASIALAPPKRAPEASLQAAEAATEPSPGDAPTDPAAPRSVSRIARLFNMLFRGA